MNGTLSKIQQDFLEMLMDHYDTLKSHLAEIETALGETMAPFSLHIEQLSSIYGINTTASCAIIAGKRNTYLSAWYWRIKQKKGAKKAIVALARKFLVIIYTMLKQGTLFDESCFKTRRKNCEQK